MKTVASTLGVARSNLIEQRDKMTQARGPYRKAEDAGLLLPIRAIIDERPTHGYRLSPRTLPTSRALSA